MIKYLSVFTEIEFQKKPELLKKLHDCELCSGSGSGSGNGSGEGKGSGSSLR